MTKYAEPRPAADALQPTLLRRSGFQARLRPGVDMTSDVKSWLKIFYVFIRFFTLVIGRDGASHDDGGSRCYPWVGYHLPGIRQGPASVEERGF